MEQAPIEVVVRNLAGNSLTCIVDPDTSVFALMRLIATNFILKIDDFRVSRRLLLSNMGLGAILPTGPVDLISNDPHRTLLSSYGVADGTEVFMGIETLEVWDLLFDFLIYNYFQGYNIPRAEEEFGGADTCMPIWVAAFNHALEHTNEQMSQLILGVCYQYNPGNVVGSIDTPIAMIWYDRAVHGDLRNVSVQANEQVSHYLGALPDDDF